MDPNTTASLIPGSTKTDIAIGIFLLTLAVIFFILYIPVLYLFCKVKEFYQNPCYLLMLSLSLSDVMSLCCWVLIAIDLLSKSIPAVVSSIVVALNCLGWRNMGWHITFLAVNRYVSICRQAKYKEWFSLRRVQIMIVFAWIHAFVTATIPCLVPPMMRFTSQGYYLQINNESVILYFQIEDEAMVMIFTIVCTWCYVNVLISYHKARRKIHDGQQRHQLQRQNQRSRAERMRRFRLAWQMFAVNVLYLAEAVGFYLIWWVPFENVWVTFALSTLLWILNTGSGAIVYLTFNEDLKAHLRQRLTCW